MSNDKHLVNPDHLVGVAEVAAIMGVTRQAVSNWVNNLRHRDGFPEPIARVAATPLWDVTEIIAHLEQNHRSPNAT